MYNQCIYDNNPYEDNPCYHCGDCENQCIYDNNPYENNPCRHCGDCENQCIYDNNPYENNPCRHCGDCENQCVHGSPYENKPCINCGECKEDNYQYIGSYVGISGGINLLNTGRISVEMDSETYYKLQSICALRDCSKEEVVLEFVEEKIMGIDVVKYVEELSNSDPDKETESISSSFGSESIKISEKELSTEAVKRLNIFAGVYKKPKNSYSSYYPKNDISSKLFNEKINEIDLIELVKEEYAD